MNHRTLFLAVTIAATAFTQDQPATDLIGTFDVVVGRRGDPQAQPLAMLGVMRAKLSRDGSFIGTLERATFPDGSIMPSLVFKGTPLTPDMEAPVSVAVEGQYTGRGVNLIVKYGDDPTKWLFGIGFSTHDPFKPVPAGTPVFAAGSTVGPEIGDQGDWGQKSSTEVDIAQPRCRDIYVNGVYHCTICDPGTNVVK